MTAPTYKPLSPPADGFELFTCGSPFNMNACLHFIHDMKYGYVEGYREASNILFKYICDNNSNIDTLIYPLLFLIRHHYELRFKNIINLLFMLDRRDSPPDMTHNLKLLWEECAKGLADFVSSDDAHWLPLIQSLMNEFTAIDVKADAFRFTKTKKGNLSLADIHHINLRNLFNIVTPVMEWLEGLEMYLSDLFNQQCEQEKS